MRVSLVLAGAQFVLLLNTSSVTIALPSIQENIAAAPSTVQWILSSYMLTFGGFILVGGRAADLYGRLRMLTSGMLTFAAASLAAGLAMSDTMLIAARALQGLSAAIAAPAAFALLTTAFPHGRARDRALAINGVVLSSGFVVGTILGGILTTLVGWRAVFFVNVPFAILVVLLARVTVLNDQPTNVDRLPLPGATAITVGLVALIYALGSLSETPSRPGPATVALAVCVILIATFVAIEAKGGTPLIPRALWRNRRVVGAAVSTWLASSSAAGTLVLLTFYLQRRLMLTPSQGAFIFTAPGAGCLLGGAVVARSMRRLGTRLTVVGGLGLQAAGILTLSRLGPVRELAPMLAGGALDGFGLGTVLVVTAVVVTGELADQSQGSAAGVFSIASELGSAAGIAVFTVIAGSFTRSTLAAASGLRLTGMHDALLVGVGMTVLAGPAALVATARDQSHSALEPHST